MRLPEQRFWDRVRPNVKQGGGIRIERVENVMGSGFPDVIAIANGIVTMVELKAVEEPPARLATPLLGKAKGLSIEQRNWHLDWRLHGGRSLVLVGCGSKFFFSIPGALADDVNKMNFADMAMFSVASKWLELRSVLKGETK